MYRATDLKPWVTGLRNVIPSALSPSLSGNFSRALGGILHSLCLFHQRSHFQLSLTSTKQPPEKLSRLSGEKKKRGATDVIRESTCLGRASGQVQTTPTASNRDRPLSLSHSKRKGRDQTSLSISKKRDSD